MKALIDGDILIYRCGFAAERTEYQVLVAGDEEWGCIASFPTKKEATKWIEENGKDDLILTDIKIVEPIQNALHNIKEVVGGILSNTGCSDFIIYLTGTGNFREDIGTIKVYKGTRDPSHKPVHYAAIKEYLITKFGAVVIEGQEADDAMAIEQWTDYNNPEGDYCETIICTIDKDLDMVPGWHYNWVKDEKYWIDEDKALYNFYRQMLVGDTVDNIPGVPQIGPKKAERILEYCITEKDMLCAVGMAYAKAYDDPEAALIENAQLLWMRREEGELWTLEDRC